MATHQVFRRDKRFLCLCTDTRIFTDIVCPTCETRKAATIAAIKQERRVQYFSSMADMKAKLLDVGCIGRDRRRYCLSELDYRHLAECGWIGIERDGEFTTIAPETFKDEDGNWIEGDTLSSPSFYSVDWIRIWCYATYGTQEHELLGTYASRSAGWSVDRTLRSLIDKHGLPPHVPTGEVAYDDDGCKINQYGYYERSLPGFRWEVVDKADAEREDAGSLEYLSWLETQPRAVRERHLTTDQLRAMDELIEEERQRQTESGYTRWPKGSNRWL